MCLRNSNYTWGGDDDDDDYCYYYPKLLKINMAPWAHPSTPPDDTSARSWRDANPCLMT